MFLTVRNDSIRISLHIMEVSSINARMVERRLTPLLMQRLSEVPAVVLLGPRQVGKTTFAHKIGQEKGAFCLDLESESDKARLSMP